MKHRIRRIGVLKAALIGGIAYALMALLLVPFFVFVVFAGAFLDAGMGPGPVGAEWMMGPAFMLLAPLIYGVLGFIGTGIAAAVYNLIAMMVGGLEVELEPLAPAAAAPAAPASPAL